MSIELAIPATLPVLTLPDTVLFPQAMLPVYVFEPRYKEMLQEALSNERLIILACHNATAIDPTLTADSRYEVATVGLIRACMLNEDGTAEMILQGLGRIRMTETVQTFPYPKARIEPLRSALGSTEEELLKQREKIIHQIQANIQLGGAISQTVLDLLAMIKDPQSFIDLASFTLCKETLTKQTLLETLNVTVRSQLFSAYLYQINQKQALMNKMDNRGFGEGESSFGD